MKVLSVEDLVGEQIECLRDWERRGEAHRMLDDLRDRVGYDVEALRATLPPRSKLREVIESYTHRYEFTTGGGCMAIGIPCVDGSYVQITDLDGSAIPEDADEVVLVGRYDSEGPLDLTADRPVGEEGCIEVSVEELEALIDEVCSDGLRERVGDRARGVGR